MARRPTAAISFLLLLLPVLLSGHHQSVHATPSVDGKTQTYVFVHGAWAGGWAFKDVAAIIQATGHTVYRPTLTGLGERVHLAQPRIDLATHIQDIVNVLEFEDLDDVILIGHSYSGMVITGVADRVPERLAHLIYVDAYLPEDGESLFDLNPPARRARFEALAKASGDGWLIPPYWPDKDKTKDVPHPLNTFKESLAITNPLAARLPGTYILTLAPGTTEDRFTASAQRARKRDWNYHQLPTGHNPHWSMPERLAKLIMGASD